ncbi:UNVERIFIED_ORG: trans-aconitate methyltransferase [Bradyrhizobium japonicum]
MVWDPQQYLKFSGHRLRPAVDLLMRIPDFAPREIADLGAGAGNVTKLIRERWPDATVTGVEGSAEMVAAGRKAAPDVQWSHEDLGRWRPAKPYDLIYSNAALHWLPNHAALFPSLMEKVVPGGMLAVQMPRNFLAPSHVLIGETALNGPWRSRSSISSPRRRSRGRPSIMIFLRRCPSISTSGRPNIFRCSKARTP